MSLQSLIDAAAAGSTLRLSNQVYREQVTVSKPLAIEGGSIRGSDVWTNWTRQGALWVSGRTVPDFGPDALSAAYVDQWQATHREQVFVDGVQLKQVTANPSSGQFALDAARHVLLADDPTRRTVEVTTRQKWAIVQADDVRFSRTDFRHAATHGQQWAIGNDDRKRFRLSGCTLSDVAGSGIALGGGDVYSVVEGCTFARIGCEAIQAYRDGHSWIVGNRLFGNGFGGWDWGWQGGAIKVVASFNGTLSGNVAHNNGGPGLWCDIGCKDMTIANNSSHDNKGPQIFYEISTKGVIRDNTAYNGDGEWPALYVSSSQDTEAHHNVVESSRRAVQAYEQDRLDKPGPMTGISIHDNTVIMSGGGIALFWGGGVVTTSPSNKGQNNRFSYPGPENSQLRFVWSDGYTKIVDFAKTPGGQGSIYIKPSAPARAAVLHDYGRPI